MTTPTRSGANVECKLTLLDRAAAARVLAELGALYDESITQTDTYYEAQGKRIKQRDETGRPPYLIVYDRPNSGAPATSNYALHPLDSAPKTLLAAMASPIAIVRKQREVWMYENVRIHLDAVENLGDFLEFEAIIDDNRDENASRIIVDELLAAFRDCVGDVLGVSNLDLMLARTSETSSV